MNAHEVRARLHTVLRDWYDSHRSVSGDEPERYVVCAGLAVLEAARSSFPLQEEDFITPKNQVKTSGPLIKSILARYGETRTYAREGGRTTRGTRPAAERLVERLNEVEEFLTLSAEERTHVLDELQGWLVDRVREYFNRRKLEVEILPDTPAQHIISDILTAAEERGSAGAVAQHLVGAKLAIRYRDIQIENHSYTTADEQLGRPGDFLVGDTVFHVTVAPMPAVLEKAARNIRNGYRAVLVVPEGQCAAARQMARTMGLERKIAVYSIESFVGQNIEEIGGFGKQAIAHEIVELLTTYNNRVAEVETDLSLMIEMPENLL